MRIGNVYLYIITFALNAASTSFVVLFVLLYEPHTSLVDEDGFFRPLQFFQAASHSSFLFEHFGRALSVKCLGEADDAATVARLFPSVSWDSECVVNPHSTASQKKDER